MYHDTKWGSQFRNFPQLHSNLQFYNVNLWWKIELQHGLIEKKNKTKKPSNGPHPIIAQQL